MNNHNFSSDYRRYMKNVKPSQELIDKTIMLAKQEQARLRESKDKKTNRVLYGVNFRKYGALAFTLILAIFAVKLWRGTSLDRVPVSEVTTTSVTTEDTTTPQDNLITTDTTEVTDTNTTEVTTYVTETEYVEDVQPIDTLTAPSVESMDTNTNSNSSMVTNSSSVPTQEASTSQEVAVTTAPSDGYGSIHATVPYTGTSTTVQTTMVPESSVDAVTSVSNNSINTQSTITKVTSVAPVTTTTKSDWNGNASDSIGDTNIDINVTTKPTTVETTTPYVTTTKRTESTTVLETMQTVIECTTSAATKVPTDEYIPEIATTTEEIGWDESPSDSAENAITTTEGISSASPYRRCIAVKVELYDMPNGFCSNGVVYLSRIKSNLSYGNAILFGTNLGVSKRGYCEYILLFDYEACFKVSGGDSTSSSAYTTVKNGIIAELNGEYSTTSNYVHYIQDVDDVPIDQLNRSTILDILVIDDYDE